MRHRTVMSIVGAAACCMGATQATGQVLDPVFANSFESGLVAFGPPLNIVAAPTSNVTTANTPLTVTLSDPAVAPTFVTITSSDVSHLTVTGGGTTVAMGQTTATVSVSGIAGSATPVTLWAQLGNTLGASVQVQEAINETGITAEADLCTVQSPTTINVVAGTAAPTVLGRLFESGVTEPAGAPAGWNAQFGYGAQSSDPRLLDGWLFLDAIYNTQAGTDDEYRIDFTAPALPGAYSYTYRFSNDGGGTWTYCDTDGAGSSGVATFSSAALGSMTVTAPAAGLMINEVDYDQVGTDTAEFIELYNSSATPIDLSTLAIVLINGNNNLEYARFNLGAAGTIAAGQYLVLKSTNVVAAAGAVTLLFPTSLDQVQNGAPDGIALVDTASKTIIDALSYEGSITAAVITGFPGTYTLVEGTALPVSVADSNTQTASLARLPNGTDSNNAATDWALSSNPTPGAANVP